MNRHIVCIMLAAALLCGCDKNKKTEADQKATAGKESKPKAPDSFESMSDPPFTANTRFAAGQLAESQGDNARAVAQYREALELDPNHRDSLFRLGQLFTRQKQFNDAIAIWQRYLAATKNSAAAYGNLGFCYELSGRYDEAETTYKAGIEREPSNAPCRGNYGLMLARRGRLPDALAQLSVVESPAAAHYDIGSVLEQQGKREEAKSYYHKALELDPKLHDAKARLAALGQAPPPVPGVR